MAISDARRNSCALREELIAAGCQVTEVLDRRYFKSIYFREPGGVLFEVATMAPGFTVDEDVSALGRELKLPPWEEQHRPEIESSLVGRGILIVATRRCEQYEVWKVTSTLAVDSYFELQNTPASGFRVPRSRQ